MLKPLFEQVGTSSADPPSQFQTSASPKADFTCICTELGCQRKSYKLDGVTRAGQCMSASAFQSHQEKIKQIHQNRKQLEFQVSHALGITGKDG
jgi:hypothetical protein